MAPQITGGKVNFSRTVKVSDYEPKKAEVELTFSVEAGEALNQDFLTRTAWQAQAQVHDMLELKAPVIKLRAQIDPANLALVDDGKKTVVRKKATETSRGLKAQGPNIGTGEERIDPDQASADLAAEAYRDTSVTLPTETDVNWDAPPVLEITDKELTDHISHKNQQLRAPAKIHALIAKFAGKAPKTHRDIPQDVRHIFLYELQDLA